MTAQPLVSVLLPVRNGMPFLPEAVESIRSQTWPNWELIVVDDHSTDGTASYLAQLTDPRIRVIGSNGRGVGSAQDSALAIARGEFAARMDADDISCPGRLAAQVEFLATNTGLVGAGTQIRYLVHGADLPAFRMPCSPERILAGLLSGRVTFCNSTMMFRTQVAKQVQRKVHGPGDDFDFFLRLIPHGPLANLPQPLVLMRIAKSTMSFCQIDEQLCGIAFAVASDRARRRQIPEPDFAAFQQAWNNRPLWQRITTKLRIRHQKLFRNAVMHRAAGNSLHSLASLIASATLWPPAVWYQLKRALAPEEPNSYVIPGRPAPHHHQR